MARAAFAVVFVAVLVAGCFGSILNNYNNNNENNSDDQTQRQHQRQQQQQIQKCSCDQQRRFFNELKEVQQQCLQQCVSEQNQRQTQWENTNAQQQAVQTLRQCAADNGQYQRLIDETIDCVDQKTQQQQQSCINGQSQSQSQKQQQQQIDNQDSSSQIADQWERITKNVRQQMEEAYEEQQQQQQPEQQKFGKAFTNQVYDCTSQCLVQKARQMDNAQRFRCELDFEPEQLKQNVAECHQKHIRRAFESVTQCAASKGQQGANEYQQNLARKNFNVEQLTSQY